MELGTSGVEPGTWDLEPETFFVLSASEGFCDLPNAGVAVL